MVLRPPEKQQQISLNFTKKFHEEKKKFHTLAMDLLCTEVLYKDQDEDDLGKFKKKDFHKNF